MQDINLTYTKLLRKISKRIASLGLLIVAGLILIQTPNSITHTCVPNVRTTMGLSSEGYPAAGPYTQHFCKTGHYPVLKYGQDAATTTRLVILLFALVPLALVLPVLYILWANHTKRGK